MSHARQTFLYLLVLFALGFTAVGAGQVLWQLVNHFIPDAASDWSSYTAGLSVEVLRFGLSAIFVAGPVLFLALRQINRDIAAKVGAPGAPARRWISYLIILASAAIGIVDLVMTFHSFLSGELTLRFALKAASILVVAGSVLGYFASDLGKSGVDRERVLRCFRVGFLAALPVVFAAGVVVSGSPASARDAALDQAAVSELQTLTGTISGFYAEKGRLPESLDELIAEKKAFAADTTDDQDQPYEFRATNGRGYELCATFRTEARERADGLWDPMWQHGAARECFAREVETWAIEQAEKGGVVPSAGVKPMPAR